MRLFRLSLLVVLYFTSCAAPPSSYKYPQRNCGFDGQPSGWKSPGRHVFSRDIMVDKFKVVSVGVLSIEEKSIWGHYYGGSKDDEGTWIEQTDDGAYILLGRTQSFGAGGWDIWLLRLDTLGDTVWTRTYGGDGDEYGYEAHQTFDGGYVIVGYTESFGASGKDLWCVKTDSGGGIEWSKRYGYQWDDWGRSITQAPDSGFMIAGTRRHFYENLVGSSNFEDGIGYFFWLLRTDSRGDTLWTQWDSLYLKAGRLIRYQPEETYEMIWIKDSLAEWESHPDTIAVIPPGVYYLEKSYSNTFGGQTEEMCIDSLGNLVHIIWELYTGAVSSDTKYITVYWYDYIQDTADSSLIRINNFTTHAQVDSLGDTLSILRKGY